MSASTYIHRIAKLMNCQAFEHHSSGLAEVAGMTLDHHVFKSIKISYLKELSM